MTIPLILAIAMVILGTSAWAVELPSPTVPDGLGVNIHFRGAPARDLDMIGAAGFEFIRMDFEWQAVENQKGVYDFQAYDELTGALAKRGIRALYILDYSNKLYETEQSVRTEEGRQAFARFAAAAAARYRGRGILWELWNEPNIAFWKPQPSVDDYMALAQVVFPAVRRADPKAICVAPATSGIPLDFLESCFRQGLLKLVDAVTVHPYRRKAPETVAGDIRALRALIARYRPDHPDFPILSGEWGYSSVWEGYDEQRQGRYLARQFLTNLSLGIPLSIWYDWHDDGPDPKESEHHFGTVTLDYTPKPAYLEMRRLVGALKGMRFVRRCASGPDDYLLVFSDRKRRAIAAWTTREPHEVEPVRGMKVTLNDAPQYFPVPPKARTVSTAPAIRFGAPLTHSDWMLREGIEWGPEGVRHMLDTCKACGWWRIYWRALDGGRSLYRSALLDPQGKWDENNFWNPGSPQDEKFTQKYTGMSPGNRRELLQRLERYDYSTFDALAEAARYGHEIGLEVHAWISINEDDHGWGLLSRFAKSHPESRWRKRDGTFYRSQQSFAFPEVMEYKLGIVREIVENYDVDGILLDWIRTGDVRDNPQTDADGVADHGYEEPLVKGFQAKYGIEPRQLPNSDERWVQFRAEPQTGFMRSVRELVKSKRSGVSISAMVAHPWCYRGDKDKIDGNLKGLLLDVRTWAGEGLIDEVVAAGYYLPGGDPEKAYTALKEETQGKVRVWLYAWVPETVSGLERDFALAQKVGARQILFWEADYIDGRANKGELQHAMLARAAAKPK